MDNPKYIPIERDLIKLEKNLEQIRGSFVQGFWDERPERFRVLRNQYYDGATDKDRKHNRWKVKATFKNSLRLSVVIYKKMDKNDIPMYQRYLKLKTELLVIKQHFF